MISSYSAMSEVAAVPDVMVSPAVAGLYGDKAGGPMVDFSYVGIDAILEQMRRKAMKQGFELNIMVVGKLEHTLLSEKVLIVLLQILLCITNTEWLEETLVLQRWYIPIFTYIQCNVWEMNSPVFQRLVWFKPHIKVQENYVCHWCIEMSQHLASTYNNEETALCSYL